MMSGSRPRMNRMLDTRDTVHRPLVIIAGMGGPHDKGDDEPNHREHDGLLT